MHYYFTENYRQCKIEFMHFPLKATLPLLQARHIPLAPVFRQSGSVVRLNDATVRMIVSRKIFFQSQIILRLLYRTLNMIQINSKVFLSAEYKCFHKSMMKTLPISHPRPHHNPKMVKRIANKPINK